MFSVNDEQTAEQNRIWLIHNYKPLEEVNKKWDASYILRIEDCTNKAYKNINDILIKWPILKLDSSYLLVYIVSLLYIILSRKI